MNPDFGVDIGIARQPTVIFVAPSSKAQIIGRLRRGELTVLVSRTRSNGWLNVIQRSTGHQGWVLAGKLSLKYTTHQLKGFSFATEATGTVDPPQLTISNSSDQACYIHIGTYQEVAVVPHVTKTISIGSGIYHYNASAANVTPLFGWCDFVNGSRYRWNFFIVRGGVKHRSTHVSQATINENRQLQTEIDRLVSLQAVADSQISSDRLSLKLSESQLKVDQDGLDQQRLALDRTSQFAIDQFNSQVEKVNQESEDVQVATKKFNLEVEEYNVNVETLTRLRRRQREIEIQINGQD